ncbi:MAG: histidinol-phosphate transaminase [Lachnospiraceae bacterium]|nr:histidinol-phosphate transaminase [Lachnospiraceae bacterium]MDD6577945.1 histidinol-phosphate transaminase [Lachnospiraceae bacterium]
MSKFLNRLYQDLTPYTPGEQPQDKKYIKLNTNESPFPPAPGVIDAVNQKEAENLRLYSDPELKPLKAALAIAYGLDPSNVFVSNGSDEALNYAFMAFGQDGILFPDITYGFYKVLVEANHLPYEEKALRKDFTIDISDYTNVNQAVCIANPNAPTGLLLSLDDIRSIARSNPNHVVMIDEAYIDFGGQTAIPLTKEFDNLLVIQTFSKSRSLAGARVGYAIGPKALIQDLETIKFALNPYNVNRISMACAIAAVVDPAYYQARIREIKANRAYTEDALEKLGFQVIPSSSNFVFARHPAYNGEKLYQDLKANGILVRHFTDPKITSYNRITIGAMEEMEALIRTIESLLDKAGIK